LSDAQRATTNEKLAQRIGQYKEFVENLVKVTTILDKNFYIVLPYSSLEGGVKSAASSGGKLDDFFIQAKAALSTKANSLIAQLDRLSLRARIIEKEELVSLFYNIFNADHPLNLLDIQAMLTQTGGAQ
jgi:hypothetical protein